MTNSPVPTTAVTTTTTSSITPIFGVVLVLNGQEVPVSGGVIGDIKKNGFKFTLPQPVALGSPNDFLAWVDTTFGTNLKQTLDPNNLPTPLANVVNELLGVEITVTRADISVPPKGSTDNVKYTIELSAAFPGEGIQLIPNSNVLLLKGGVAGVSNDPTFTG